MKKNRKRLLDSIFNNNIACGIAGGGFLGSNWGMIEAIIGIIIGVSIMIWANYKDKKYEKAD